MGIGGGKSSGSSAPVVTQEQKDFLKAQTDFLTGTAFPQYTNTINQAGTTVTNSMPWVSKAATEANKTAEATSALQQNLGTRSLTAGTAGLASLFDPQYERNQINAALQAGRESARESQAGQNAMYGAAGGLGSSRMALADRNLASLNEQRQATAAADAQAKVQANKAAAAQALMSGGQSNLSAANAANAARIGYANAPMDLYSKYASVVFGTPQQSTTPNFSGTQGQTTSGKGGGFQFGK
jgi:hypothetical protein